MTFLSETPFFRGAHRLNRPQVLRLLILVALTVLAAVAGPFGTFENGGFPARLVYWAVAISVSLIIALGFKFALRDLFQGRQFWLGEAYVCLGTTLIFTPFLYVWTAGWFAIAPAERPDPLIMGLNVLAICVIVSGLRYGMPKAWSGGGAPDLPRLADRLSDTIRGPILRLEAEGHFVHIVTEAGSGRVRMRLADAIREMEPVSGHLTHRSHWVATSAVTGMCQDTGRRVLRLANRDVVPVSRTFHPELEAAGLL